MIRLSGVLSDSLKLVGDVRNVFAGDTAGALPASIASASSEEGSTSMVNFPNEFSELLLPKKSLS